MPACLHFHFCMTTYSCESLPIAVSPAVGVRPGLTRPDPCGQHRSDSESNLYYGSEACEHQGAFRRVELLEWHREYTCHGNVDPRRNEGEAANRDVVTDIERQVEVDVSVGRGLYLGNTTVTEVGCKRYSITAPYGFLSR